MKYLVRRLQSLASETALKLMRVAVVSWGICGILIGGLDGDIGHRWNSLGLIVSEITAAFFPANSELPKLDLVTEPVVGYVDRARPFLLDCVVGDTVGYRVVGNEIRGRLLVAEGSKHVAERYTTLGSIEGAAILCFSHSCCHSG